MKDLQKKTLYVSDLDGTLLRGDQTLSDYTIKTINELIQKGIYFTYATARSHYTSSVVTEGLKLQIPVVVYNGTMLLKDHNREVITYHGFGEEGKELLADLMEHDVYPIVYKFTNQKETFTYLLSQCNPAMEKFIHTRKDEREVITDQVEELFDGDIFHFTCIDEKDKLEPMYEKYKEEYSCVFFLDQYIQEYWLEIMPRGITKAGAIEELRQQLGCERVVVFGDGRNDIDMFHHADEAYAMENAVPELKAEATAVIGSNEEDGVARWMEEQMAAGCVF